MSAILNSLNAHNLSILQQILMILVSKFMVHRALSDTTYLSLGLLSPLTSPEPLVKIYNSFTWMFPIMPSTKIAGRPEAQAYIKKLIERKTAVSGSSRQMTLKKGAPGDQV